MQHGRKLFDEQFHQQWKQARHDFHIGVGQLKEHLSLFGVEAKRHWSTIREELKDGSESMWKEFRRQVRRVLHRMRTKS